MDQILYDTAGWLGALLYLGAYFLVSSKRLAGDSRLYQGLNVGGGVLLVLNSWFYRAMPSVFVNIVWIAIAAWTLLRVRREKGKHA